MRYDKVMVMKEGEIMEFDEPQVLLNDTDSMFHSLVHNVKTTA